MTVLAGIDCGTNSLRLLVAECGGGRKADLHREMRVVRLGEGVDATGRLSAAGLARTGAALRDYAATCRALGAQRVRLVATSATRDATNREEFAELVRRELGIEPEVVPGAEEARLSFHGATRGLPALAPPYLVVDIGGGSTEVVLGTDAVEASCSVDIGCVRLTERHLHDDPPTAAQVAAAGADVSRALAQVGEQVPVARARTLLGLAGSVTTVAAVALGLAAYDPDALHLARVSRSEVTEVTGRLLAMTSAERAALPVMHPGRVDVIGAGALVLDGVMATFGFAEVVASEADILDGIVWSMAERGTT